MANLEHGQMMILAGQIAQDAEMTQTVTFARGGNMTAQGGVTETIS